MLSLPPAVRLFVARDPVDMRKAFDGLAALVRETLREDPYSGHLYVFLNRRKDRIKVLWWDRSGYALLCKRLEQGTFALPVAASADSATLRLTSAELSLMLEGLDLRGATRRPRYARDE